LLTDTEERTVNNNIKQLKSIAYRVYRVVATAKKTKVGTMKIRNVANELRRRKRTYRCVCTIIRKCRLTRKRHLYFT